MSDTHQIGCREAHERVLEWLDGELDEREAARIGEHLLACARCHPMLQFERSFRDALDRLPRDPCCPDELREKIMGALASRGFESDPQEPE